MDTEEAMWIGNGEAGKLRARGGAEVRNKPEKGKIRFFDKIRSLEEH